MPHYQAGDAVQINTSNLLGEPGSSFGESGAPSDPPQWVDALIERRETSPDGEGTTRYHVLITSGRLAGRHGTTVAQFLRPRPPRT